MASADILNNVPNYDQSPIIKSLKRSYSERARLIYDEKEKEKEFKNFKLEYKVDRDQPTIKTLNKSYKFEQVLEHILKINGWETKEKCLDQINSKIDIDNKNIYEPSIYFKFNHRYKTRDLNSKQPINIDKDPYIMYYTNLNFRSYVENFFLYNYNILCSFKFYYGSTFGSKKQNIFKNQGNLLIFLHKKEL